MTAVKKLVTSPFSGFYKLSEQERYDALVSAGLLTEDDLHLLRTVVSGEMHELADNFVENSLGCMTVPMGIVPDVVIDGETIAVPMAVEETSIIAAACNMAKWVRLQGELVTETVGECALGQIYFPMVTDVVEFVAKVDAQKEALIACANQDVASGLVARGGGVKDLSVRTLMAAPDVMKAVVHVHVNTVDAMGANIINQICEYLKHPIEALTESSAAMCIVSNLVDTKLTRARIRIRDIDPMIGAKIEEASHFAELDPYRASTGNKGVMNGMDAVLLATGNDWRAVEAGVHAYAARHGEYRSITRWRMMDGDLVGELEAPVITGSVGGVTKLHPIAQLALRLMKVRDANHLSRIVAAMGLLQNLGALKALTGEGIVRGHMTLHIKNLMLGAGASDEEVGLLQPLLAARLAHDKKVSLADAKELLATVRGR